MIDIINEAKRVFDIEIESLEKIREELDENFILLVNEILNCSGRIIITGMGKSGHVGRKIAATMSSLGIPSYFLHPAEAAHGDLGIITREDIVITISNSGETDELIQLIPSIKKIDAKLVSISCRHNSTLEKYADIKINIDILREASAYNLAPTTSTTATLVFGDALAVVLSKIMGFKPENFALFHPKGILGKKLLTRVSDLMYTGNENPLIHYEGDLKKALIIMSEKGLGAISVVNDKDKLIGIITDGDLRRCMESYDDLVDLKVKEIMTKDPIVVNPDLLAIEALKLMENRKKQIMVLPVVNKSFKPVGMIRLHDIVKAGIMQ